MTAALKNGETTMRLTIGKLFVAALCCAAGLAVAAEPVNITYGYHPYWTGGWNGVIIKAKELWKKYLPPGSEVEFQTALQGSIIVNQMLADKQQIGYLGDMPAVVSSLGEMHDSGADPVVILQDLLELGDGARFNTPGTSTGNWSWRLRGGLDQLKGPLQGLGEVARRHGR